MFAKLLVLFTVLPIVELYLLVKIGKEIGTLNTIAVVIITGILGAAFARSQGVLVINQIQAAISRGEMPGRELVQGALVLIGAVMLITPGFITDVVGLSFLFPLTRAFYTKQAIAYFKKRFQSDTYRTMD